MGPLAAVVIPLDQGSKILYSGAIRLKYAMILEYINAALERANYEIIEDAEPYYGEIPELPGVFATGRTLEECRRNLAGVIDEWLIVRLRRGLPIPPVAGRTVGEIVRVDTGAGA
jgi:predicted RNase H-like HicB family nuclease